MGVRGVLPLLACVAAGLGGACQGPAGPGQPEPAAMSPPEASPGTPEVVEVSDAPAPRPAVDWSAADDCLEGIRLLDDAVARGALAPEARIPIAALVHDGPQERLGHRSGASFVSVDLPLQTHGRAGSAAIEPCLIEIGPPDRLEAEQRIVAREQVASEYHSSTRSERNPEYDAAKAHVEQIERRLKSRKPGVLSVGDPMLDLIGLLVSGVLTGFSERGEELELEEALEELARTPRTREQPTYRPYTFQRTVVHADKHARVPVLLRDRASGRKWRADLHQHERREFSILDGLDARDRDLDRQRAGSITPLELEQWQLRPPKLQLSSVVAALVDAVPAGPESLVASAKADSEARPAASPISAGGEDTTEALRGLKGPAALSAAFMAPDDGTREGGGSHADPRLASIVRVTAGDRTGAGFYVRPDLILTTYGLASNATLIDLTTAAGHHAPGLLAAADPERDLALVQIPKLGPPAALHAGAPASRGFEVLSDRNRTGAIVVALGQSGAGLMLRVQEPLPDDLVGAPVFLDQAVIGVLSRMDRSGGMSMVPASDVMEFVDHHAGALR